MPMLADTALRSQVDSLWDKLWTGGLSNPLDAIEQLSFLIFLKQLDEREQDAERTAKQRGKPVQSLFPDPKLRWSYWSQLPGDQALKQIKEKVFSFLKTLGSKAGSFAEHMATAEFKINKASLLIEACKAIDELQISARNQDVQGDLYEYLLSRLNTAGTNGQFRTPRHIIRMMVKMLDPKPGERICDPAAGTCGFLVNAWQHILETHTEARDLTYDADGWPHNLTGSQLKPKEWEFSQSEAFTGYDNDSGMTMLRIGSMNLMLHGLSTPRFHYTDTLSKLFNEEQLYDVVLANPPFKGAIDAGDVNPTLPTKVKKTEILFLHLFLRLLENGGRAAVIVPEGVLFGPSNAHIEIRKKLIENNRLDAVISMPAGVFRPYAGVSTAVLMFTKGMKTERVWFYEMEHDGLSLDDKRLPVSDNDIPDILQCWKNRADVQFHTNRSVRIAKLKTTIEPLKADRIAHQAAVHRLKFEEVVADYSDNARTMRERAEVELSELQTRIAPIEAEINQLNRQFWVDKKSIAANKYDLSASRYREVEHEKAFREKPTTTIKQLEALQKHADQKLVQLEKLLAQL
jgi:type I restriction enzyme M protein